MLTTPSVRYSVPTFISFFRFFNTVQRPLEASRGYMLFNCSTNAITKRFAIACCKKHLFSTNTKIMLMGTQIFKVPAVFVLPSITVIKINQLFYLWVMNFKKINRHCLNLIQKDCIITVVNRSKTQLIMFTTIWSQVVYKQGM